MDLKKICDVSRSEKKKRLNMAKKSLLNGSKVKSITILTAENPNSQKATSSENKKMNKELRNWFSESKYLYCPVEGKFGNTEHSFAIFNISIDIAKRMASKYKQTSFIFIEPSENDGFTAYYYEVSDITKSAGKDNEYKLINSSKALEKVSGDDNYTLIGKDFKFKFPDEMFVALDKVKDGACNITFNGVGLGAYAIRSRVYSDAINLLERYYK